MALEKTNIIILGAGMGSRMKSKLPKVLHKVAGKTLMNHLISSIEKIASASILENDGGDKDGEQE